MKSRFLLLPVAALLVSGDVDSRGASASAPSVSPGASDCASVPEDGEHWLQPLCNAIHEIAAGAKGTTVRSAELRRNANGTVIDIDFQHGTVGSSIIARLLSGSAFVPTDRVDQLVIQNAILDGKLDLSHATIEVAAKFQNVEFNPKEGKCNPLSPSSDPNALVLVGAEVKKRLTVENSVFCGDIEIASSQLHSGLQLGGGPDTDDGADDAATQFASLFVVKSDIEGDLVLSPARASSVVSFDRNILDTVTIVRGKFAKPIKIIDNQIRALSVWYTDFHDEIVIEGNTVSSSISLNTVRLLSDKVPVVRDNDVDGGLRITLREINSKRADFSHNTVDRSADIWLRTSWPGIVDLNGSAFGSQLALCLARYDDEDNTLYPIPASVDTSLKRNCGSGSGSGLSGSGSGLMTTPTAMASEETAIGSTEINLRSVEVATLAWRLPLNCSFRWDGSGLRYRHWAETTRAETAVMAFRGWEYRYSQWGRQNAPPRDECTEALPSERGRNKPLIGSSDGLMRMRYLMKENDVDALNTMADYLESRGKIVESRDIREEAKRANYLNIPEHAGILDTSARRVASYILAPVGYGAKPELSLIWLFGVWLVSYCLYRLYSRARRIDWEKKLARHSGQAQPEFKQFDNARRTDWKEKLARHTDQSFGYSQQPGFMQFDKEKDPKDFDILRYSIDAMIPVINLHTYDRYYPENEWLRRYAAAQHAVGWFLITIFLVSAAIL